MPRSKEVSQRMRSESRAKILASAKKLFASRGYFSCKISDIAHEADMSQGNVYWYFASKEALLKAVLTEGFNALEEMTAEAAAHPGPSLERLSYLIDRTMDLYDVQAEFMTILGFLMSHGGTTLLGELGFDMMEVGSRYHGNLIPLFEQARSEKIVADIEINLLIMFYFGFFNGLMLTYGAEWSDLPKDHIRNAALRLLGCQTEIK
ncbi:MAG TPA: TetR/AcrR family transcriptional regulator [Anaerolineae bacterium]|nr:TetR/AcrR family transcriptional regulator [Anaerolineae bacterium]